MAYIRNLITKYPIISVIATAIATYYGSSPAGAALHKVLAALGIVA